MDALVIFGAKYLLFVSAAAAVLFFLKMPRSRQKEMLIFAVIIFPASYILAKIVSLFYFDPRPFVTGHFTPLLPHAPDNGFPSDHTLLGTAIAAVVYRFNKKTGLVLFGAALLVGFARILAGVHHFADILGSVIVVLAVYAIAAKLSFFRPKNR